MVQNGGHLKELKADSQSHHQTSPHASPDCFALLRLLRKASLYQNRPPAAPNEAQVLTFKLLAKDRRCLPTATAHLLWGHNVTPA